MTSSSVSQTTQTTALKLVRRLLPPLKELPWAAIIILAWFLFVAVFANALTPYTPEQMTMSNRLHSPGFRAGANYYLLGTDNLGRDLFTRILFGARISLIVAAFALLAGGGIGLTVGIVSGYIGGKLDAILMRFTDCFLALPPLLIALVFVMSLGPGLTTVIIALAIITWARFARNIRAEVLTLKERDFVMQARVAGCSSIRIMVVHIFPNVLNTFMILASINVSHNILTEATLSFLGAGIPPPSPTWGNMVSDGTRYIASAWWIGVFPGLALTLVVFSLNQFTDWLRDKLDPKLRQM